MSFTNNIGTNIGKVRLWTQDNVEATAAFSDEEINYILGENANDIRKSASQLLFILASNKAKLAKLKSAGKYSEDTRTIAKELREQAQAIIDGAEEPVFEIVEQTFGPLDKPYDGAGEKEFIDRDDLRKTP